MDIDHWTALNRNVNPPSLSLLVALGSKKPLQQVWRPMSLLFYFTYHFPPRTVIDILRLRDQYGYQWHRSD